MPTSDERLTPATRNYVIFGLLFVGALALAAKDLLWPKPGRGETDSPLRLLIVGGSSGAVAALDEVDGFSILELSFDEVVACGRDLVDDDAPAYAAAIACADERGYGFAVLGLDEQRDWGLDTDDPGIEALPPDGVRFVVFSVGELAEDGPRMNVHEIAPLAYEPPVAELDAIRLAIYEHPDLQALWDSEPTVTHLQAREVLRNRGLFERRETLLEDQAEYRELTKLWPEPGVIPGSLAGSWEQTQAAPIRGGVLVEARAAVPTVTRFRSPKLVLAAERELYFVSRAQLLDDEPDESLARQRCEGLPTTVVDAVAVAPDGHAVVIRERPMAATVKVLVFDEQAAAEGRCVARLAAEPTLDGRAIGRPNASGRMAWSYDDADLFWFDADGRTKARVSGIDNFSGPWWVDDDLLAMIAETTLEPPDLAIVPILVLLDTAPVVDPGDGYGDGDGDGDGAPPRLELDTAQLFGDGELADLDAHTLIDLRPSGPSELLLLTERCVGDDLDDARPCLHRLRASDRPLVELVRLAEGPGSRGEAWTVETLGPIGPYLAIAIAAEGGRAAWIAGAPPDVPPQLWTADLRGPAALEPRRLDDDALPDAAPRISADGRVVLSEVSLALGELGSVSVARAFVLPEPTPPPRAPNTDTDTDTETALR